MSTLELLTLDEYLQEARGLIAEGLLPSEAVDKLGLPVNEEALRNLARIGAIFQLGSDLHDGRRSAALGGRLDPPPTAVRHQKDGQASVMFVIPMAAADGRMKMLADFTIADWADLQARGGALIRGWRKKVAVGKHAESLLRRHGAEMARKLPKEAFAGLEREVAAAW
jgi:hypothetical protein